MTETLPPADPSTSIDPATAIIPFLPDRRPRVPHLETLSLLQWPDGCTVGSDYYQDLTGQLLDAFCRTYRKEATQRIYRKSLQYFLAWWAIQEDESGQRPHFNGLLLRRYAEALESRHCTGERKILEPRTVNTYLAALRAFCRWLQEQNRIHTNPMHGIRGMRVGKGFVRDSLTEAEVGQLLATFDRSITDPIERERVLRDYAMTVLWVATGVRSIEIARAQRRHLTEEEGAIVLLVHGKGRDTAELSAPVVLEPWALEPLHEYLEYHEHWHVSGPGKPNQERRPDHPLFAWLRGPGHLYSKRRNMAQLRGCRGLSARSIQEMMLAHLKAAKLYRLINERTGNIRPISPHSIRHTAASIALEHGAELHQVQQMLRHTDIQTTELYVHHKDRIRNAAERKIPDLTKMTPIKND